MKTRILLLAAAGVAIVGCGGSGGGTSTGSTAFPAKVAGTYNGTYNDAGSVDSGTLHLVFAANGGVTGTGTDNNDSTTSNFAGTLNNDGSFNGTATPPSGSPVTLTGNFTQPSSGHLKGTITTSSDTYTYNLALNTP